MDQEKDIPSDATNLINIESPELPDEVPVSLAAEGCPTITIETDEVQTETDPLDKGNGTKNLFCSPTSSNGRINYYFSPNISSKEDLNPDRQLHRSTSLKTNSSKTSSSDPLRKKEVRFADAFGLDLADVRHFNKNLLPTISKSAFTDLEVPQNNAAEKSPKSSKSKRLVLVMRFLQPVGHSHFFHRVRGEKVCLENAIVDGKIVKGFIRVANLGYQKQVQVIYTTNGWNSKSEVDAVFIPSYAGDQTTDRFLFAIHLLYLKLGVKLIFVIKYVVSGKEFWDNNFGNNYTLECVANDSVAAKVK